MSMLSTLLPTAPISRRVRVYFAPVNRVTETPSIFDPSQAASFDPDHPSSPWVDLGWVQNFARTSDAKISAITTGAPSVAQYQVRQSAGARVSFAFEQWTKLTMALAGGAEHMNILVPAAGAPANGSGGASGLAQAIIFNGAIANSATEIVLSATDLARYSVGSLVAVDVDYTGQIGFVGSGSSAAYVRNSASVNSDIDYVRRMTLNVAVVRQVTPQALVLAQPLLAGTPVAGMKVQPLSGFVDREGGTFLQEWSALFVMSGEQGDALFFHYPRLQAMQGPGESQVMLYRPLEQSLLSASFRALPVIDNNDGQAVLCFRTYIPAPNATV